VCRCVEGVVLCVCVSRVCVLCLCVDGMMCVGVLRVLCCVSVCRGYVVRIVGLLQDAGRPGPSVHARSVPRLPRQTRRRQRRRDVRQGFYALTSDSTTPCFTRTLELITHRRSVAKSQIPLRYPGRRQVRGWLQTCCRPASSLLAT